MSISIVQQKASFANNGSSTPALTTTPTVGNVLLCCMTLGSGHPTSNPSVNVPSGWTLQKLQTYYYSGSGQYLSTAFVMTKTVASGDTGAVLIDVTNASGFQWYGTVYELSGVNTSSPVHAITSIGSTGNGWNSYLSLTPTVANTLPIICSAYNTGTAASFGNAGGQSITWTNDDSAYGYGAVAHGTLAATANSAVYEWVNYGGSGSQNIGAIATVFVLINPGATSQSYTESQSATFSFADSAAASKGVQNSTSATVVTFSSSQTVAQVVQAAVNDAFSFGNSPAVLQMVTGTKSDTLATFADSLTSALQAKSNVADGITFGSSVVSNVTRTSAMNAVVVSFNDSPQASLLLQSAVSDAFTFLDSVKVTMQSKANLNAAVSNFADMLHAQAQFTKSLSDMFTFADSVESGGFLYQGSAADTFTFADTLAVRSVYSSPQTQDFAFSSSLNALLVATAEVADSQQFNSAVGELFAITAFASDTFSFNAAVTMAQWLVYVLPFLLNLTIQESAAMTLAATESGTLGLTVSTGDTLGVASVGANLGLSISNNAVPLNLPYK